MIRGIGRGGNVEYVARVMELASSTRLFGRATIRMDKDERCDDTERSPPRSRESNPEE